MVILDKIIKVKNVLFFKCVCGIFAAVALLYTSEHFDELQDTLVLEAKNNAMMYDDSIAKLKGLSYKSDDLDKALQRYSVLSKANRSVVGSCIDRDDLLQKLHVVEYMFRIPHQANINISEDRQTPPLHNSISITTSIVEFKYYINNYLNAALFMEHLLGIMPEYTAISEIKISDAEYLTADTVERMSGDNLPYLITVSLTLNSKSMSLN